MKLIGIVVEGNRAEATIESELKSLPLQIEEVGSAAARNLVLAEASKAGIKGMPGISRTVNAAFPVNSDGVAIENLTDEQGNPLPPQHPRMQPVAYRATYEITARQ